MKRSTKVVLVAAAAALAALVFVTGGASSPWNGLATPFGAGLSCEAQAFRALDQNRRICEANPACAQQLRATPVGDWEAFEERWAAGVCGTTARGK